MHRLERVLHRTDLGVGQVPARGTALLRGALGGLTLTVALACASDSSAPTASLSPAAANLSKTGGGKETYQVVVITPKELPPKKLTTAKLKAVAYESPTEVDSDADITWFSTDPTVAVVSPKGVVLRLQEGKPVQIGAYSSDNGGACTTVGDFLPAPVVYKGHICKFDGAVFIPM
ncbi:MAG: hypothetical protein JWN53_2114 [Gemmatimonadetes bacterium]|jgi:hypothetical protein|nr:hypothetical protein [Gemmatimonadota bacterium]